MKEALIAIVLAASEKLTRDDAVRLVRDILAFFSGDGVDKPAAFAPEFQPLVDAELEALYAYADAGVHVPEERPTEKEVPT